MVSVDRVDNSLKISNGSGKICATEDDLLLIEASACTGEEVASASISNGLLSVTAASGWSVSGGSNNLTGGNKFTVSNTGQSFGVEVRFVKGTEAKLEFFLPPPTTTISDGASLTQERS